ncbi:hypothetical protein C8R47DRAFT_1080609 [Mycena vitilis]|nr:hypothetical protein C8R47DRAFT_1080609 [Mycena vitilis]
MVRDAGVQITPNFNSAASVFIELAGDEICCRRLALIYQNPWFLGDPAKTQPPPLNSPQFPATPAFSPGPFRCPPCWQSSETPFARALVSQSSRWHTLHVYFAHDVPPPEAFDTLRLRTLPILQRLILGGYGLFRGRTYIFFRDAPALHSVPLGDDGLTTYKATYTGISRHIRNLIAAPNLVDLALSHPLFLSRLNTPALQSLSLGGTVDPLLPFLQHHGRTEALSSLTLTMCATPVPETITLLRHTHGLTALALELSTPPGELVLALVASERLCPPLGSLSLRDWNDELDRDAFVELITSRCRGSGSVRCTLYAVAIYSGRERIKTAESRLRALPRLEVLVMNSRKGKARLAVWKTGSGEHVGSLLNDLEQSSHDPQKGRETLQPAENLKIDLGIAISMAVVCNRFSGDSAQPLQTELIGTCPLELQNCFQRSNLGVVLDYFLSHRTHVGGQTHP